MMRCLLRRLIPSFAEMITIDPPRLAVLMLAMPSVRSSGEEDWYGPIHKDRCSRTAGMYAANQLAISVLESETFLGLASRCCQYVIDQDTSYCGQQRAGRAELGRSPPPFLGSRTFSAGYSPFQKWNIGSVHLRRIGAEP
jgi:hypothetical protein